MGLALAILVAVGTFVVSGIIILANGALDAPSVQSQPVLPWFISGMVLAGILALIHFVGW